jgi:hypothetical protein
MANKTFELLEQPALRGMLPSRSAVNTAVFSPDGWTLAATGGDNTVILWDVARHTTFGRPFAGHKKPVTSIAFSPDGKTLASGDESGIVILWDVARHMKIREPLGEPAGGVWSVALSPDGETLASLSSRSGAIILWDVASRTPRGEPLAGLGMTCMAFSPDGQTQASGAQTGPSSSGPSPAARASAKSWSGSRACRCRVSASAPTAKPLPRVARTAALFSGTSIRARGAGTPASSPAATSRATSGAAICRTRAVPEDLLRFPWARALRLRLSPRTPGFRFRSSA